MSSSESPEIRFPARRTVEFDEISTYRGARGILTADMSSLESPVNFQSFGLSIIYEKVPFKPKIDEPLNAIRATSRPP